MASPTIPAPGACARSRPRSTPTDLRTGRGPVAGLVLALVLLLVLLVMTWVNVARPNHDQDRVDRTYRVLRGLDIVLAHLTSAEAGRRSSLRTGPDGHLAPSIAGQEAVAREIDTVAALTADSPAQRQRIRQLRSLVQQEFTWMRSTAAPRRSRGLQAVRVVVLQDGGGSVIDRIRSLTGAVQAEERSLPGVRRADAASTTRTIRTTLVVAGLVGLLLAAGAATGISRSSTTGPPHHAVAVLPGPGHGRLDQRRRPTTQDEVGDTTSETVVPTAPERIEAEVRTVAVGTEEPGARIGESDDLVLVTTSIAQQTEMLALDATIEAARARDGGKGLAGAADEAEEHARETAQAAEDIARWAQAVPADTGAAVAAVREVSGIVARISDRQRPAIAAPAGVGGVPRAVASGERAAGPRTGIAASSPAGTLVRTPVFAAARSRAHGPTTALWHAVQLHRPFGEVEGPCELAVCGSLVRVSPEQRWPVAARDVCPACATLAH